MSLKVAIASNDGQNINEHFNTAKHFLIFHLRDNHFRLAEVREIESPHCYEAGHNWETLSQISELLADCYLVLASKIGPGAVELLKSKGVKALGISGSIDRVLAKLVASYEVKNYLKARRE